MILDPYASLTDDKTHKTTIVLGAADVTYINSLHERPGTLKHTIGNLLAKLCLTLRANGVDGYDPDEFERLVSGCTITLPTGSPVVIPGGATGETSHRDDGRGVVNLAKGGKGKASKRANPKRTPQRRNPGLDEDLSK